MGKKSKKRMAEAKAMMEEAIRMKEEAIRMATGYAAGAGINRAATGKYEPPVHSSAPGHTYAPAVQARTGGSRRGWGLWAISGVGALVVVLCFYLLYNHYGTASIPVGGSSKNNDKGAGMAGKGKTSASDGRPTVLDTWEMPDDLKEISSIAFIDADRIACVQDQKGIIYTYNLKEKELEKELKFGDKGDYEGVVAVGSLFYVLRADGVMFEVPADGSSPAKTYDLPLNVENDTEPMFYEQSKNRILVGVKEKDPTTDKGKGIYSFDLKTKKMNLKPVVVLSTDGVEPANANTAEDKSGKKAKGKWTLSPSEIAIHPKTGEIYVLNGPKSEFIVYDATGKMKSKYQLDKKVFPQPEGMTFSPTGDLYIATEASKKAPAIIAKVAFSSAK